MEAFLKSPDGKNITALFAHNDAGAIVGALFIQTLTTTMYSRNVSADVAPVPKAIAILAVCLLQSPLFRRKAAALIRRKAA